jgi:predicted transcriptional regulator
MSDPPIMISLDAEATVLVRHHAMLSGVTVEAFCAEAIKRHAEENAEIHAFIREGLDSAGRGELYTQEEMRAWLAARFGHEAAAE